MSERLQFVEEVRDAVGTMTEICARFGISRRVGYKWLARYRLEGPPGLLDRRRAPTSCPHRTDAALVEAVLHARRRHPSWGPRKLVAWLAAHEGTTPWPAPSTVGTLLSRAGLVVPRRRRAPKAPHPGRPTTPLTHPNTVWTTDFKGEFRTTDGRWCYPLTVLDGATRFCLGCQALARPSSALTRPVFVALFQRYGLPERLRSDNGTPFASTALAQLSRLSVWWLKLGIVPECIEPAHPEQNGRHERFHRTLLAETARPPAASRPAQQRRFRVFRREYNTERPHEALGQTPPSTHYTPSPRPYPPRPPRVEYPPHFTIRRVGSNGGVRWHSRFLFLTSTLADEDVGFTEIADDTWALYFGPQLLAHYHTTEDHIRPVRHRPAPHSLLPMSPV